MHGWFLMIFRSLLKVSPATSPFTAQCKIINPALTPFTSGDSHPSFFSSMQHLALCNTISHLWFTVSFPPWCSIKEGNMLHLVGWTHFTLSYFITNVQNHVQNMVHSQQIHVEWINESQFDYFGESSSQVLEGKHLFQSKLFEIEKG